MKQKILEDLKRAMKEKEELKLSVLRMLSSALKNKEIEKRGKGAEEELDEGEVLAVLRTEVKKRKDAAEQFKKGGREDLAKKESRELKILETYLPQEISDEEIEKVVRETISSLGEVSPKDFGKVMGAVMKKIGGQASGERVKEAVLKAIGN